VVVDPSDASAWAQALDELLEDEQRREELRARGLARAREFTWEHCAELTVAAYRKAVDR
jgi:alpha-1,3-rhamnosyl/mannosyltransferase